MQKKIMNLVLVTALLLQVCNICIFAYNKDEFYATDAPDKVDYCQNFPKNQYGQTVDIDCAFTQLVRNQVTSDGRNPGKAIKIGPNGEHEIRLWHRQHILTLWKTLRAWLLNSGKNILKYSFIGNLIEKTGEFLSLNSTILAAEVTKNWLLQSQYFKNYDITAKDIDLWKKAYIRLPKFTQNPNYTDYEECKFLYPLRYFCKKNFKERQKLAEQAFNESLRQENIRLEQEAETKAKAYYLLMEQIFHSILKKGYEGQDTLVGILDFSQDNYEAQAYFTNIGLPQKIRQGDVEDVCSYNENLADAIVKKENKNNKDDL